MSDVDFNSIARKIRRAILTSTSRAGSGHPTSSLSAVELMTVLFFGGPLRQQADGGFFRQDYDRFILSKGHAAPLLYSLYYAAGLITEKELLTLRQFGSRLEGHPTPRFPYVDVATGSLGQGLSVGLGMCIAIKRQFADSSLQIADNPKPKTTNHKPQTIVLPYVFVLLGDSEMAEGQVWEAMETASYHKAGNLIAIVDVNRLGQRGETALGWDLETYKKRAEAFGWEAFTIENGHDLEEIKQIYTKILDLRHPERLVEGSRDSSPAKLVQNDNKPKIIFARTIKGKGVSFLEDKNGWHGKTLNPEELKKALGEIGGGDESVEISSQLQSVNARLTELAGVEKEGDPQQRAGLTSTGGEDNLRQNLQARYKRGELYSTRLAFGQTLADLGKTHKNILSLDAEVSNSTCAELFGKEFPQRFFEMFIAEQNMVSTAVGMSVFGFIPFVSTFGAFLTRAFDQIRMASYSEANIKLVGSHVGVSIGQDGTSQMGLEDIAMMRVIHNSTVLYPSDAVSTKKLVKEMVLHKGIDYLRITRMETPVIYDKDEEFPIGGLKILRQSDKDIAVVIGAGITVHEALKAYEELKKKDIFITVVDLYSVKPLDEKALFALAQKTKNFIMVEDHYTEGGIGEAVSSALSRLPTTDLPAGKAGIRNFKFMHLAVRKTPRSGKPDELLNFEEIDSKAIISVVEKEPAYV